MLSANVIVLPQGWMGRQGWLMQTVSQGTTLKLRSTHIQTCHQAGMRGDADEVQPSEEQMFAPGIG